MRVAEGAYRAKTDGNGAEYYLHRLDGAAQKQVSPPRPPGASTPRADPHVLHRAYSKLLARLELSRAHRVALQHRGLDDDTIDREGFRTLPVHGRAALARVLREQLGDTLLSVPGFVVKQGKSAPYVTISGAAGLLVPVRDVDKSIIAMKVRHDDGGNGSRYSYLSSTMNGGPGPGSPVHVPIGLKTPCPCLRVTEGELKSVVATTLSGLPTVSIAGVGTWRLALPVLRKLEVKTVRIALDMDAGDKPQVAKALVALAEAVTTEGYAVELERWSAEHKGIDDALAAGATLEVLTADAALQAIAGTLTEATAGEASQEPSALDRLTEILAEGGIEALFRDRQLLAELAALAENNPAEFACRRAQLEMIGVKLRDLDRVLAPLRQDLRRQRPPLDAAGCYRIAAGRIVRDVSTKDGPVEVPLANWSGRIVEEIEHDDGADRHITFAVEGALADGTPLPRAEIPAEQFGWMHWPVEVWGTRAVVFAGFSTADHLRVALQLLSPSAPRRIVYGHTGWRNVAGQWDYLHGGGAIGRAGAVEGVDVNLPDALAGFRLPAPPSDVELIEAVRASLRLLELGPDRITVPVVGSIFRAVLGPADFSLQLTGRTGLFKTELAALAQQHFGQTLNARNLPGSWMSTGNSLETLAFSAKDALVCVDDFAPSGSATDVQRYHREADRLIRAQGNSAGRSRCRADGSLKPGKAPRGLILSTGEDVPRGQSLRARLLVLELSEGDITSEKLTPLQQDGARGLFASCMAGFLVWLAQSYGEVRARLHKEHAELRDRRGAGAGQHARTPGIVADLVLGLKYFLDFAVEVNALTDAERDALDQRCWVALTEAAAAQTEHDQDAEPCGHFLRLLAGAIASGRGHAAGPDGGPPGTPERWGWLSSHTGGQSQEEWRPHGHCVGWVDGADLYLEPEAAYAEAQEIARHQGVGLPIQPRTLWKRMRDRGLLATWDSGRQRNTVRRTLGGEKDRNVLHLRADVLSSTARPSGSSAHDPSDPKSQDKRTVSSDSHADSLADIAVEPSDTTVRNPVETGARGQFGRSDVRGEVDAGGDSVDCQISTKGICPPPGARLFFADAHGRPCSRAAASSWCWEGGPRWYDMIDYPPASDLSPSSGNKEGAGRCSSRTTPPSTNGKRT
jgi:hypothetical protein